MCLFVNAIITFVSWIKTANDTNAEAEKTFADGSKECWVYKLASAYSAAPPSLRRKNAGGGVNPLLSWGVAAVALSLLTGRRS